MDPHCLPVALYELGAEELRALVAQWGQPDYRTRQIWGWLYRRWQPDVTRMTDVPLALRQRLSLLEGGWLRLVKKTVSADALATKYLFELADGAHIETVLMHDFDGAEEFSAAPDELETMAGRGRNTVCVSTQVGCAMGCVFCATGQMGFQRQLSRGECVAQIAYCAADLAALGQRLSNVVFMGMGEPLANSAATLGAVAPLVDPSGTGLSPRRVTVSTVGVVPGIRRLAASGLGVRLAVSIHAPNDELRRQLVPIDDVYPLADLLAACRAYQEASGRRITFEYVLIDGWNDQPAHARALARRLRGLRAHVNLIPLNPTPGCELRPSPPLVAERFRRELEQAGVPVTLRSRRGLDIQAGCGQLATATDRRCLARLRHADRAPHRAADVR